MSSRTEERWMFSAASVCLCVGLFVNVCQHDNFGTSKTQDVETLGGGRCSQDFFTVHLQVSVNLSHFLLLDVI